MVAVGNKPARKLTSKEMTFATHVASGDSQAEAYRRAYARPNCKDQKAAEEGSRIAARPLVRAKIAELRERTIGGRLLTVNDRLQLLAESALLPTSTAGERSARARCLDVYTKLAGGAQPEQHEVTHKGDPNAPVQVAVTVSRAPVRDRLAALRAAKLAHT